MAIFPLQINNPIETAMAIWMYCVINKILRLSNLSAVEPPIIVRASIGNPAQSWNNPSINAEVVSVAITQTWVINCMQVPVSELSEPMLERWKGHGGDTIHAWRI